PNKDGQNLFCRGQVDVARRNLGIFAGSAEHYRLVASLPLEGDEACQVAETLWGEQSARELGGACDAAPWNSQLSELAAAEESLSLAHFENYCIEQLEQHAHRQFATPFSWDQVKLSVPLGGSYTLTLENPAL